MYFDDYYYESLCESDLNQNIRDGVKKALDILMEMIDNIYNFLLEFFLNMTKSIKQKRKSIIKSYDNIYIEINKQLYDKSTKVLDSVNSFMLSLVNATNDTEREVISSGSDPVPIFYRRILGKENPDLKSDLYNKVGFNTLRSLADNPSYDKVSKTEALSLLGDLLNKSKSVEKTAKSVKKLKLVVSGDIRRYGDKCATEIKRLLMCLKKTYSAVMSVYRTVITISLRSI